MKDEADGDVRGKDEQRDKPVDLELRRKQFALRIIRLYLAIPKSAAAEVIGKQMLGPDTCVGAHCREAI